MTLPHYIWRILSRRTVSSSAAQRTAAEKSEVKKSIQLLARHENPYIRTCAARMQKQPYDVQVLILEIINLLSRAS